VMRCDMLSFFRCLHLLGRGRVPFRNAVYAVECGDRTSGV
jgi:hypothetical protein